MKTYVGGDRGTKRTEQSTTERKQGEKRQTLKNMKARLGDSKLRKIFRGREQESSIGSDKPTTWKVKRETVHSLRRNHESIRSNNYDGSDDKSVSISTYTASSESSRSEEMYIEQHRDSSDTKTPSTSLLDDMWLEYTELYTHEHHEPIIPDIIINEDIPKLYSVDEYHTF